MSKTSVITARVDDATLDLIDKVAKAQGRSRAWFVAQAVRAEAERLTEEIAFAQVGIDAIERGEYLTHEEMVAWWEERKQRKAA